MTDRLDFVGVGGIGYDLILRVARLPNADEKLPATFAGSLPGGFIANATCAAARLGLATGYVGHIGDDVPGHMLRDDFARYGIHLDGLAVLPGETTPFTVILNSGAERAILLPGFPLYDAPLASEQITAARRARVVYTFPRDAAWCESLASAAHESGGLFALDIETAAPLRGDALRRAFDLADIVFLSEGALAGFGVASVADLAGERHVILTAGKDGAYGVEPGSAAVVHQPVFPVQPVDTTGAGDSFHAAFLAAHLWDCSFSQALRFASAAAALKIQHPGARGGLPTREEVERFLN